MQNLSAGMDTPVVLDMKVGTRHYSPGEGEVKVAKELKKAATTTIGTLGLRVVGCKVPSQDNPNPNGCGMQGAEPRLCQHRDKRLQSQK